MEGQIGIDPLSFSGTVRFVCLHEGYFGNVKSTIFHGTFKKPKREGIEIARDRKKTHIYYYAFEENYSL